MPADADLARQTRLRDRFYDLYVQEPMQKVVGDRLRPAESKDPFGVEQAKARLQTAYGMIEEEMGETWTKKTWAMGDEFSMADCAAAPSLFYANLVMPFGDTHKNVAGYFGRLMERPSFARAVEEAKPYFAHVPEVAGLARQRRFRCRLRGRAFVKERCPTAPKRPNSAGRPRDFKRLALSKKIVRRVDPADPHSS